MLHPERKIVGTIAATLEREFGKAPGTAIVLGSGLGSVTKALVSPKRVSYEAVGLPGGTVVGHASELVRGVLGTSDVVICSGRIHSYEGRPMAEVVRCVRALSAWGVKRVLLTCSVGGIREGFKPGTLVNVADHINFQRSNPLTGPAYGTRFPDLSTAYDPKFRDAIEAAARKVDVKLYDGVLACMNGPAYESPAEVRMLRHIGADIVGMSTVPEILALAEIGVSAAVLAVVSNRAAGLTEETLTHDEVTEASGIASASVHQVINEALRIVEQ